MKKKTTTLTVFTPAYNRAHTLNRTYQSLCLQTSKDFEWLIIDDGSTDNTRELVERWIEDSLISIRYIYQHNQGMHGAHNTAYKNITTELNTCIDSDDWLPKDAVEKIISFWRKNGNDSYAGLVGLDQKENGEIIGTCFPNTLKLTTLQEYYESGGRGDKKLVYRTDVVNQYPEYPIFKGEKYVGLNYKYMLIDQDWKLLVLNEPLVVVDYQEDGSSYNMYQQYWNNPKGFSFLRKIEMKSTNKISRLFMVCVHYVSSSIICKNKNFLKDSPRKILTFLAIIPGIILYYFIKFKVKKNDKMKL